MHRDIYGALEPATFQNAFDASWCMLVTMTTVGFGDLYPVTGAGRSVTTIAMIVGMFATAMPVTVLGNRFAEEYDREEYKKLHTHYMVLDSIAMGLIRFFNASASDDAKELIKENLTEVQASRDLVRKIVAETDMKVKIRFLEEDLGRASQSLSRHEELSECAVAG
jgi:hypothetical protein